jgi:acyl-CoA thioester hydrolase
MLDFNIPLINKPIFIANIPVRIYDINYGNHLGHDALVSIIHEARLQFLRSRKQGELNEEGVGILITQLAVNYIAEAFYGDKLVIYIEVGDTTRATVELLYKIQNEDTRLIATAYTRMAFFDYQKRKVVKMPENFAQLFS